MCPNGPQRAGSAAQILGRRGAAAMDERDDEQVVVAQLIDDAPGVRGDFAEVGVIEFGHAPADAQGLGQGGGAGEDVAHNGLGVGG